jgi:hypothetical protein
MRVSSGTSCRQLCHDDYVLPLHSLAHLALLRTLHRGARDLFTGAAFVLRCTAIVAHGSFATEMVKAQARTCPLQLR